MEYNLSMLMFLFEGGYVVRYKVKKRLERVRKVNSLKR